MSHEKIIEDFKIIEGFQKARIGSLKGRGASLCSEANTAIAKELQLSRLKACWPKFRHQTYRVLRVRVQPFHVNVFHGIGSLGLELRDYC